MKIRHRNICKRCTIFFLALIFVIPIIFFSAQKITLPCVAASYNSKILLTYDIDPNGLLEKVNTHLQNLGLETQLLKCENSQAPKYDSNNIRFKVHFEENLFNSNEPLTIVCYNTEAKEKLGYLISDLMNRKNAKPSLTKYSSDFETAYITGVTSTESIIIKGGSANDDANLISEAIARGIFHRTIDNIYKNEEDWLDVVANIKLTPIKDNTSVDNPPKDETSKESSKEESSMILTEDESTAILSQEEPSVEQSIESQEGTLGLEESSESTPGNNPGKKSKSLAPLIGAIIIIVVLLVIAVFAWIRTRNSTPKLDSNSTSPESRNNIKSANPSNKINANKNNFKFTVINDVSSDNFIEEALPHKEAAPKEYVECKLNHVNNEEIVSLERSDQTEAFYVEEIENGKYHLLHTDLPKPYRENCYKLDKTLFRALRNCPAFKDVMPSDTNEYIITFPVFEKPLSTYKFKKSGSVTPCGNIATSDSISSANPHLSKPYSQSSGVESTGNIPSHSSGQTSVDRFNAWQTPSAPTSTVQSTPPPVINDLNEAFNKIIRTHPHKMNVNRDNLDGRQERMIFTNRDLRKYFLETSEDSLFVVYAQTEESLSDGNGFLLINTKNLSATEGGAYTISKDDYDTILQSETFEIIGEYSTRAIITPGEIECVLNGCCNLLKRGKIEFLQGG